MDGIRAGSPERSIASEQTAVMNASKFKWVLYGVLLMYIAMYERILDIYIHSYIYICKYYIYKWIYIYTRTYVGMYIMMCLCRSIYKKNHMPGCMRVCLLLLDLTIS